MGIKRLKFRVARLQRLLLLLLVLFSLTVGVAVGYEHLTPPDANGCLMTIRDNKPIKLFDMRTGTILQFRDRVPSAPGLDLRRVSPDGNYVVYLKEDMPGSDHYTLWVEDMTNQRAVRVQANAGLRSVVKPGSFNAYNVEWSPDSSRFAYLWATDKLAESFIVTAKTDGSDRLRQENALAIQGWSSDSAYLASVVRTGPEETNLTLWSFANHQITSYTQAGSQSFNAVWSPQHNQIAYLEVPLSATQPHTWLTLLSIGKGIENRVALPIARTPYLQTGVPQWSPDGRYVSLIYRDQQTGDTRLDVYGIDGSGFPAIAFHMPDFGNTFWSADGQSIAFAEKATTLNWKIFHIAEKRTDTILHDIVVGPAGNFLHQQLASWRENGTQTIELMAPDGTHRFKIAEDANETLQIGWSPEMRTAMALWATGLKDERSVHLSVIRNDGTAHYTPDTDYRMIRDLTWLNNGQALAYIGDGDGTASAGLIDIKTGQQYRLLDNKVSLVRVVSGIPNNLAAFLWTGIDGNRWLDGFDTSGQRTLHFQANRALPDGVFLSPDQKFVALKITTGDGATNGANIANKPRGYGLMLSSADGTTSRILRTGLMQINDVYWSSNGKMLAFSQIAPSGLWALEVVTADGVTVQNFEGTTALPERFDQVTWTQCEAKQEG